MLHNSVKFCKTTHWESGIHPANTKKTEKTQQVALRKGTDLQKEICRYNLELLALSALNKSTPFRFSSMVCGEK